MRLRQPRPSPLCQRAGFGERRIYLASIAFLAAISLWLALSRAAHKLATHCDDCGQRIVVLERQLRECTASKGLDAPSDAHYLVSRERKGLADRTGETVCAV